MLKGVRGAELMMLMLWFRPMFFTRPVQYPFAVVNWENTACSSGVRSQPRRLVRVGGIVSNICSQDRSFRPATIGSQHCLITIWNLNVSRFVRHSEGSQNSSPELLTCITSCNEKFWTARCHVLPICRHDVRLEKHIRRSNVGSCPGIQL